MTKVTEEIKEQVLEFIAENPELCKKLFNQKLEEMIEDVQKFQVAHRKIVEEAVDNGLNPVYTAGFISLDKQFVTLGVSGHNEAAELLGMEVGNNQEYKDFMKTVFSIFKRKNTEARKKYGIKFNTECVPAESLGVKFADWNKKDGIPVNRDCFNSYLYLSESPTTSIIDKFELHGGEIAQNLDGGQALHLNIAQLPDKEFFLWLRDLAGKKGTSYWTTNVMSTCCRECGNISFETKDECPYCGSTEVDYATRVIGFCKKLSSYSDARKEEHSRRYYH